jgi:hypothetical protein
MRDQARKVATVVKDAFMAEDDFKGMWNAL